MFNPLSWLLTQLLVAYQKFISPMLGPRCRYYPSCSSYALGAIKTHGAVKGSLLSTWRVLRCNPWSLGGVDHVPPKGSWKSPEWIPPDDWVGHDLPDKTDTERGPKNR